MDSTASTPPRRWLRFSVRSILVLMVIVAIPLAWKFNRVRAQKRAVEAIERAGGIVIYLDLGDPGRPGEPPGPAWLQSLVGVDFFDVVDTVEIGNAIDRPVIGRPDDLILLLQDIPNVRSVTVCDVSDSGVARLSEARSIVDLYVDGNFGDAGLAHVGKLTELQRLGISSPHVSEAGLIALRSCTQLYRVDLYDPPLSTEQISRIRESLPGCSVVVAKVKGQ